MGTYRVFANFSEVLEIVVEANSEQEANDIAFATDFDEWSLFANEFDGSETQEL